MSGPAITDLLRQADPANPGEPAPRIEPKPAPAKKPRADTPGGRVLPRCRPNDALGCRRWLTWTVENVASGALPPNVSNALVCAINSLLGAIADTDLAQRIERLERDRGVGR